MSKDKGIKPATSKNVEIKLDVLNNEELQNELKILKLVFEASYGPSGRTNFIQHVTGGHVTVTSKSSQILKNITTVSTPLTRLLLQSAQGHLHQFHDGGLFTALLTLQLIECSLNSGLPRHTAIMINELALNIILGQLESSNVSMKLPADLGNVEQMLCVIRSILTTKPASGITSNELQSLAVLLLRGFLGCIPKSSEEEVSLDNLRIQACEGPSSSESCLKTGILLEAKSHPATESKYETKNGIKVALFDCSLAGNVEDKWMNEARTELSKNTLTIEDYVLTSMISMVDELIGDGVKLVACQKVIHPTLQKYLSKKGLYSIERLSICHIQVVQKLTGAKLLSSFQGKISAESFGSLAEIKSLIIHKKRYLQLIPHSSSDTNISTLVLCAPDEHSLSELKLQSTAALHSLKQLVYHPFLVPGAGCFETNLAALLMQTAQEFNGFQELGCSKQKCLRGLHSVASAFLRIARTLDHDSNNQLIDRATFHHWTTRPLASDIFSPQHCQCGLVTSDQDTEWYMTEELQDTSRDMSVHQISTGIKDVKNFGNVVLDVMSMKVNGINTAFETANTILRVKHFVKETFD